MTKLCNVYSWIILLAGFEIILCSEAEEWDVLIFTQSWPITVCRQWTEKDIHHSCSFPSMKGKWTVHGIWPTKFGTRGPGFCDPSWTFDPAKIKSIESDLDKYWPNIQNGSSKYDFWKHEWEKHGTCAASLAQLNSEEKYFKKGIEWARMYDLSHILAQNHIYPGADALTVQTIAKSIKNVLDRNPYLECYKDRDTLEEYILEIRICFDKKLELVDCDGITSSGTRESLTNCPEGEYIFYLNKVPPKESGYLTALMLATFLQWLTR